MDSTKRLTPSHRCTHVPAISLAGIRPDCAVCQEGSASGYQYSCSSCDGENLRSAIGELFHGAVLAARKMIARRSCDELVEGHAIEVPTPRTSEHQIFSIVLLRWLEIRRGLNQRWWCSYIGGQPSTPRGEGVFSAVQTKALWKSLTLSLVQ